MRLGDSPKVSQETSNLVCSIKWFEMYWNVLKCKIKWKCFILFLKKIKVLQFLTIAIGTAIPVTIEPIAIGPIDYRFI